MPVWSISCKCFYNLHRFHRFGVVGVKRNFLIFLSFSQERGTAAFAVPLTHLPLCVIRWKVAMLIFLFIKTTLCPLKLELCLSNLDFFYGASLATVKLNGEFSQRNKKNPPSTQQFPFFDDFLPLTWFTVVSFSNLETVGPWMKSTESWKYWMENGLDFSCCFQQKSAIECFLDFEQLLRCCWLKTVGGWLCKPEQLKKQSCEEWIANPGVAWSAIGPFLDRHHCHHEAKDKTNDGNIRN